MNEPEKSVILDFHTTELANGNVCIRFTVDNVITTTQTGIMMSMILRQRHVHIGNDVLVKMKKKKKKIGFLGIVFIK